MTRYLIFKNPEGSGNTNVPGSDNNISFGGMCLPKDTNALNAFMNIHNTPHNVINAVITEQSIMRDTML